MFCKKCGQPMDDGAKFCENCGTPVEIPQAQEIPAADSVPVATPVDNLSNEPKNEMHDVPADDGVNAADLQSDIASSGKSSMSDNGQGQPPFGQNGQFDGQNVQPAGQNGQSYPVGQYDQHNQPVNQPYGAAYGQFSQDGGQMPAKKKTKKGIIIAAVAAFVALAVALGVFVIPSLFVGSPKDQLKRMGMDSIKTMTTALEKSGEQLDTGVTSNAKVTPGEGLLAILEASGYSLSSDVLINVNQSVSKEGTSAVIALNKGDDELMTINTVFDNQTGNGYLSAPALNSKVLQISPNQVSPLAGTFANTADLKNLVPESDAFNIFLSDSYEIFVDGLGEVTRDTDNLVVGGITKKCTVLSVDVTERELTDIAIEIAENSKDDEEFSKFMDAIVSLTNQAGNNAKSYDDLIDEAVENLKNSNPSDDVLFKFSVWTENGKDAAGVKIDVDEGSIYYTALSSGSEWAFDLGVNMGESFIVSGSGTKSGNLYNGSAAISYNGNELLGLDIVNADGKSGDGTYTVYIKDGLANLVSGVDSATLTIIKTAKIEFTKTTVSEGNENLSVVVYGAGTELMTVEVTAAKGANTPISIPEGEIVTDSEEWNQSMNVYFLLGLMSEIGLY